MLADNYFRGAPALAYFRDHAMEPFTGGAFMQFNPVGKIYRMRLTLGEKDEIIDLGAGDND